MANLTDIGYGVGKYLVVSDASAIPGIGANRKNLDLLNFKVAVNNAYALYNFKDGMIDAYQTEGGVDTSGSTDVLYDSTSKYYYGGVSPTATGGTVTTVGDYTIHSFLAGGNFITDTAQDMSVLVVGGAGGGGGANATYRTGGGGAGGVRVVAASPFTAATHAVVVGAGGAGGTTGVNGTNGSSSSVNSITASGGGGGGGANLAGSDGASGGGGSSNSKAGGAGNTGSYSPVEGYAGGGGDSASGNGGGGGGGAGAVGRTADYGNATGGYGGAGLENDYRTGSPIYYGGGGGGGSSGAGGAGGGGTNAGGPQQAGTPNTGGGGSAGTHSGNTAHNVGGAGGSGIVVIKRETIEKGNMTLLSTAQTAQAAPDEGRLMLYEEDVDAITPGTDIKGYVSRDAGTTWSSAVGLVDDGADHIIPAVDNTGGIDANTLMMLHMDGSNDGTTFTDNGTVAQTFTPTGAVTKTGVKKFGTASGYFDGNSCAGASAGEYLTGTTATISGNNSYTIDFWMYPTNIACAQWQHMVGISDTSSNNSILGIGINASNELCSNHYANDFNSGFVMSGNVWQHVAVVYDGTTEYIFSDGDLKDTRTGMATFTLDGTPVIIGAENWNAVGSYPYEGYLDEVRISNVARWTASFVAPIAPYTSGSYTEPVLAKTVRVLSGSVDISGQPSGTSMKYKIETLNDKNLKLHGASLLWA